MLVYLFGYLADDFFGRVLVVPSGHTVGQLARQLIAWGPTPERVAFARTLPSGRLSNRA